MADIFDEINEDIKRDQMQEIWARYGKYLILCVSLIVLGVAARQGYNAWQERQAEAAATEYHTALSQEDVVTALTAKLGDLSPGYAMLAEFRIAAEHAAKKDFDAAEAAYLALSVNSDIEPLYQQAAILLSVMNAPDNREVSALSLRLAVIEGVAGPWQALALEQAAGLALRAGDRATALAKYETLAGLNDIPVGMRQRASQMVRILKG